MSVTDGSLTTDGAQQSVRVIGSITTTPGAGTQTVAGTVTANQGTAAALASGWPIKVTDGTVTAGIDGTDGGLNVHVRNTTNVPVSVNGTATISGQVQLKDGGGTNIASVFPSGSVKVQNDFDQVGAGASITAATGAITGTTVNFATPKRNISLAIIVGAGVSGGVIDLQVSQDGNNWIKHSSSSALVASTNQILTAANVAFQYARAVTSTNVAGGNVTVTIQGS